MGDSRTGEDRRASMPAIQNAFTVAFGVSYPVARGLDAAMVSVDAVCEAAEAGVLGCLEGSSSPTPEALARAIAAVRQGTDRPFALRLPDRFLPGGASVDECCAVLVESRVPVAVTAGRVSERNVRVLRAGGVKVIHRAADVQQARLAEQAGADAVLLSAAQPTTGATSAAASDARALWEVASAVAIPVVAAAGFSVGAGLAAALALGASAVEIGTRAATEEEPCGDVVQSVLRAAAAAAHRLLDLAPLALHGVDAAALLD